ARRPPIHSCNVSTSTCCMRISWHGPALADPCLSFATVFNRLLEYIKSDCQECARTGQKRLNRQSGYTKGMQIKPKLKIPELKMETLAVHAGRRTDPATGAVTPPIHLSTTFERGTDGEYPL